MPYLYSCMPVIHMCMFGMFVSRIFMHMKIGVFFEVLCVFFISHWIIRLFYAEIRHKIVKFGMVFYYYVWFRFASFSHECVSVSEMSKWQSCLISVPSNQTYLLCWNNNQQINVLRANGDSNQQRMTTKINARQPPNWEKKTSKQTNEQYFKI